MEQKDRQLIVFLAGEIRNRGNISALLERMQWDVYAADAGYRYALDFQLNPKLIFGDFDSMDKPRAENLLVYPCEKDQTDSELALDLALEHGYRKVCFVAPFGGRLDHTLANLNLLKKAKKNQVDLKLYDGENLVFLLEVGVHLLEAKYRYISFIATEPQTVISLEGFKYPLSHKKMPMDTTLGISNEPTADTPIVTVHSGAVLCICIEKQQEEL